MNFLSIDNLNAWTFSFKYFVVFYVYLEGVGRHILTIMYDKDVMFVWFRLFFVAIESGASCTYLIKCNFNITQKKSKVSYITTELLWIQNQSIDNHNQ